MSIYEVLTAALAAEEPVAVITIVEGTNTVGAKLLVKPDGTRLGSLGDQMPQEQIIGDALAMLTQAESGIRTYPAAGGDVQVFIETYPPPPTLFIVGAVHIAIPLVTFGKMLGFRTVVIDARGAFATEERFAHADELVLAWPDEALEGRINSNSYVVLLTHDPKLDDPALKIALPSQARYVGALGSTRTHASRVERLTSEGVPREQLDRLYAPIGLPLGGRTPEEIALSIIAQIVAVRNGTAAKEPGRGSRG
jgi:xanthine dehydrogenase accessory factor